MTPTISPATEPSASLRAAGWAEAIRTLSASAQAFADDARHDSEAAAKRKPTDEPSRLTQDAIESITKAAKSFAAAAADMSERAAAAAARAAAPATNPSDGVRAAAEAEHAYNYTYSLHESADILARASLHLRYIRSHHDAPDLHDPLNPRAARAAQAKCMVSTHVPAKKEAPSA